MGLFNDIFLSKQEKHVVDIYNNLMNYWKATNDFAWAHNRYFSDLNKKHRLGISDKLLESLPYMILVPLLEKGLSQDNSMFIFAQYIVFYIFRNDNSGAFRYSDETLVMIAENITELLIPYKSRVTPEFTHQIDKNFDIHWFLEDEFLLEKAPPRNQSNREFSIKKLASRIGCSPDMLKQSVFEQLKSMNATIESCNEVIVKHQTTTFEQAEQYNMHPDDTPAAIMIEITEEYIEKLKSRKKSDDQIFQEMVDKDSDIMTELLTASAVGDMDKIKEIIKQNPEFLDEFMRIMAENEEKDDDVEFSDDLPF